MCGYRNIFGLYEKQNTHFFFLRFISTKKPSLFDKSIVINFDGISSRTETKITPLEPFLSNLWGVVKPLIRNFLASYCQV